MKNETMNQKNLREIVAGIASGQTMIEVAGRAGVDRSTLRQWLNRPQFLQNAVKTLSSPDEIGEDALSDLLTEGKADGERADAYELRQHLRRIVERQFPQYFAQRAAEEAAERAREEAARQRAEERAERESAAAAKTEARNELCRKADLFNLQTVVAACKADWERGTAEELKMGLTDPDSRRAHREKNGIRWTCAGFGVYYSPAWSAERCRMEYDERENGYGAVVDRYKRAWREIEAEQKPAVAEAYRRDPFARRDPNLPTAPDEARRLWEAIQAGVTFAQAVATSRRRRST